MNLLRKDFDGGSSAASRLSRRTAASHDGPPLPIVRLLAIGVGLPTAIAALNYAMMSKLSTLDVGSVALYFVSFILEVGLVGLVVGYHIEQHWLRWTIYSWIMLLINLLTFSIVPEVGLWRPEGAIPAAALFAGQIGLCVTWACFGDGRWPVRVALMAVASVGLYYFWGSMGRGSPGHNTWDEMLLWQVAALAIVCSVLRLKGFRLAKEDDWTDYSLDRRRRLKALQFGIRDVMIWTTVLAVFLGVARALDMLSGRAALDLFRTGAYWKMTVTTISAMAIVVAIWIALGSGDYRLRVPAGMSLIATAGMLLAGWSSFRAWRLKALAQSPPFPDFDSDLIRLYEIGPWWLAWVFLTGGLLAAMLIVLQARGYRLVRQA